MLDERPVSQLRIRPQDLARRAALEQRKLREMISFCYADHCYRAFILDYFGDRSHKPACGSCGVCTKEAVQPAPPAATERDIEHYAEEPGSGFHDEESPFAASRDGATTPASPRTRLDKFVIENTPFASDLDNELDRQSLAEHRRREAESFGGAESNNLVRIREARPLGQDETLCVRKILACAARMGGRYGKAILAATLRGSRSAKISQFNLERLSTYGILSNMTQDEILLYVDALVAAGALSVTGGNYPTISITALGNDVMHERASVELALPSVAAAAQPSPSGSRAPRPVSGAGARAEVNAPRVSTIDETYAFYEAGMTIEEISRERGIAEMTVEKHLADCILEGRPFDISQHVNALDRALIEEAVRRLGGERLKPLRDALPRDISYRMIRFVVADMQRAAASVATTSVDAEHRRPSEVVR
jgi:ATP-dependent DNA helicase RecQ